MSGGTCLLFFSITASIPVSSHNLDLRRLYKPALALVQWLFPHALLQHLLHNLCCDWQASINLARLCSIIISPAIQLDSTQWASWHCVALQRKFPVSRRGCRLLLQWIFYWGTCQYNAESSISDKHVYTTSDSALWAKDVNLKTKTLLGYEGLIFHANACMWGHFAERQAVSILLF